MKPDTRNADLKNVDDVVKHYLPSVQTEHMESDAARVLDRLRSMAGQAVDRPVEERFVDLDPVSVPAWRGVGMAAAVAAVVVAALGTAIVWRSSGRPALVDGSLYRVVEGNAQAIRAGNGVERGETIRTNGGAGAMLALADGSRVEMRSQSELSLERADDGVRIRLGTGSIIVNAAKQGTGHLYVQTKDMTVSVVGTIFFVNAERDGSRVAVIEGEVRVHEGTNDTKLRPGEQVSTSRTVAARPVKEEIAWSRQADAHLAILAAFTKGMAETAGPLRPLANAAGSAQATSNQTAAAAAPRQEFEEASIRPCDPDNLPPAPAGARGGGANSFQMTPGRTHALCLTLATIVRHAYGYGPADLDFLNAGGRGRGLALNNVYGLGVEDGKRVRGGPDWVRSNHYTIDAVADGAADAATMSGPMMRELLERRFQLKVHIETEQIPAFALTVARGGLKMKEGTCIPTDASSTGPSTPEVRRRNQEAARRGETSALPCGFANAVGNGPNILLAGARAGVPSLGAILGVPIIDRTGIPDTARFNFVLEFLPDENTAGPLVRGLPPAFFNGSSDVPRAPNIFTALEEQLGLKLEPARAPREFIVIDRVERPSPN